MINRKKKKFSLSTHIFIEKNMSPKM